MELENIILSPVLTEKTNLLREGNKKTYVFRIHLAANKYMVTTAIERLFKVRPEVTRVVVVKGKPKRVLGRGGKGFGKTARYKKAYVTLAAGAKIDKFEGA